MSELRKRVHDLLPGLIGDLEALVCIQSVSADPERLGEVEKSAQMTAPAVLLYAHHDVQPENDPADGDRLAPADSSANAVARLREHLAAHVPGGAELTVTVVDAGEPTVLPTTGPAYAAARAALAEALLQERLGKDRA